MLKTPKWNLSQRLVFYNEDLSAAPASLTRIITLSNPRCLCFVLCDLPLELLGSFLLSSLSNPGTVYASVTVTPVASPLYFLYDSACFSC